MSKFLKTICFFILLGAIVACSRKRDNFISRSWHSVTAEYNILYNGNLALKSGQAELNTNYQDNYWDLLPIERMQIDQEILLPDSIRNQNFGIAENKAVKAIQRHSMFIGGKETNPQIDEAYLLLGKARYFDQRFIPALEAFNYVLQRYPASNSIRSAQIWREKTNIRLENNRIAIENLQRIIENSIFDDQDYADAHSALAQAYVNLRYPDSALAPLTVAAKYTKKNEEKGRYYFILGQLYNQLNQPDNANLSFDEVIALNRKTPRVYRINAFLEKAANFNFEERDPLLLKEVLNELASDRENRPFLDKIYFQLGEYYKKRDSLDAAIAYYNKSLRVPVASDRYLRSIDYEILANINFDRLNYQSAAKYFDSTLFEMPENLREYRTIKRKRKNLDNVILYQGIAERNDSILKLIDLPEEKRLAYFKAYADSLKNEYLQQIEEGRKAEALTLNMAGPDIPETGPAAPDGGSSFYFYNERRQIRGGREFVRIWGKRDLSDNWRWDASANIGTGAGENEALAEFDISNDPRFKAQTYVDKLPKDRKVIDSLHRERNNAYYNLGIIYNERFEEPQLAVDKLEALLANDPEERLILPAKFNLYKAYNKLDNTVKREQMKKDIITNYSDSQYAIFIQNPEQLNEGGNMAQLNYERTYALYEDQQFKRVITESDKFISRYSGEEIAPKFELLKANAIGRLRGLPQYRSALEHVALTYPRQTEGQKAKEIIDNALPQLERLILQQDSLASNYKLLYKFRIKNRQSALELKQTIDTAITDLRYSDLSTSLDAYSDSLLFLVVHGLEDRSKSLGFAELLKENEDYLVQKEFIVMSTDNYRVIQVKKNLEKYLEQRKQ